MFLNHDAAGRLKCDILYKITLTLINFVEIIYRHRNVLEKIAFLPCVTFIKRNNKYNYVKYFRVVGKHICYN